MSKFPSPLDRNGHHLQSPRPACSPFATLFKVKPSGGEYHLKNAAQSFLTLSEQKKVCRTHLSFYKVFYISSWKLDSHWKGVGTSLKPGRSESSGFFAYSVASPWWDRPRSAWQKTLMLKASLSQYIYSAVMLLHLKPKQNKMGANFTLKWDLTVVCHILRSDFFHIRSVKPV